MKDKTKKKVVSHIKDDIKTFKGEIRDDKKLINSVKTAKKKKK